MMRRIHLLAILFPLLATACTPRADLPREHTPPPEPPDPAEVNNAPSISVAPTTGAPGDDVRVEATGMPALTDVVIGFGLPESEYDVLERYATDADGLISEVVQVPAWANDGRAYVWVVATPNNEVRVVSQPFQVQATAGSAADIPHRKDGEVRVEGVMTDEGVECPALRTDDGTLYTLAGAPDDLAPGDRVVVEGSVAEMSFCQQGATISVRQVQRR